MQAVSLKKQVQHIGHPLIPERQIVLVLQLFRVATVTLVVHTPTQEPTVTGGVLLRKAQQRHGTLALDTMIPIPLSINIIMLR